VTGVQTCALPISAQIDSQNFVPYTFHDLSPFHLPEID
jgi:hypothetical protein